MMNGYHKTIRSHGLKSLIKCPTMPNPNLAIGADDEMSDVPLLIFRNQKQPSQKAVLPNVSTLTYEETAAKGANDTLSMENFVTDDFQLGDIYA